MKNLTSIIFILSLISTVSFADLTAEEQLKADAFMQEVEACCNDHDTTDTIRENLQRKILLLSKEALPNTEVEKLFKPLSNLTFLEILDLSGHEFNLYPQEFEVLDNINLLVLDETVYEYGDDYNWGKAELTEKFGSKLKLVKVENSMWKKFTFRTTASYS